MTQRLPHLAPLACLSSALAILGLTGCGDPAIPAVPDGASLAEAQRTIEAAGFQTRLAWEESRDLPAGTVVGLTPSAGTVQPEGATVKVALSSGYPFSAIDVLEQGSPITLTDGPADTSPEEVIGTGGAEETTIQVGDTPDKCWGFGPDDVVSVTAGSGDSSSGSTMTFAVIETSSTGVAKTLIASQRAANAECVARSPLTWQSSPTATPFFFATSNAATAPVAGYPAYLTTLAVTSMPSGAGEAARGAEVMWQQDKYLLVVRDSEVLNATSGTYGYPRPPSGPPPGLEEAAEELRGSMSVELDRIRRQASARAAARLAGQGARQPGATDQGAAPPADGPSAAGHSPQWTVSDQGNRVAVIAGWTSVRGTERDLASLIRAWGEPASARLAGGGQTCIAVWTGPPVEVELANWHSQPAGSSMCDPSVGRVHWIMTSGDDWRTDRGLAIGDTWGVASRLYPKAKREKWAERTVWLLKPDPYGAGCEGPGRCFTSAVVGVEKNGRLARFELPVEGAE